MSLLETLWHFCHHAHFKKHLPTGWWTVVCHALGQEVGWRSKIFTLIEMYIDIHCIQFTFCFLFCNFLHNKQECWNRWGGRLQFETQPVRRKAVDRRPCFPYLQALWPPSSCVRIENMELCWFLRCRNHYMIMIISMIWEVLDITIFLPQTSYWFLNSDWHHSTFLCQSRCFCMIGGTPKPLCAFSEDKPETPKMDVLLRQ